MVFHARIMIAAIALASAAGCSAGPQIIQFSSMEQATTVKIEDRGEQKAPNVESTTVLDNQEGIGRLVAFFKSHNHWELQSDDPQESARYSISFRRNGRPTERFTLDGNKLWTTASDGRHYAIVLNDKETDELIQLWRFAVNFRSRR